MSTPDQEPIQAGKARLTVIRVLADVLRTHEAHEKAFVRLAETAEALARALDTIAVAPAAAFTLHYLDAAGVTRHLECHATSVEELRIVLRAYEEDDGVRIVGFSSGWPERLKAVQP